MRVVGEGKHLWRLEVVLWTHEPGPDRVGELVDAVTAATAPSDDENPPGLPDVEPGWSYDIQPPEGGVGVACWVRSDSIGEAAERGWTVVSKAAVTVLREEPRLWDLRVIPREAILVAPSTGTPLTS
jgi:hypothetical protein